MREMMLLKELGDIAAKHRIDCFIILGESVAHVEDTKNEDPNNLSRDAYQFMVNWNTMLENKYDTEYYDSANACRGWLKIGIDGYKTPSNSNSSPISYILPERAHVTSISEIEWMDLAEEYLDLLQLPYLVVTCDEFIDKSCDNRLFNAIIHDLKAELKEIKKEELSDEYEEEEF